MYVPLIDLAESAVGAFRGPGRTVKSGARAKSVVFAREKPAG
jgi:hypothetical protein